MNESSEAFAQAIESLCEKGEFDSVAYELDRISSALTVCADKLRARKTLVPPPALTRMPVSKMIFHLTRPGERVTAKELAFRAVEVGAYATPSAITMALIRAERAGKVVRVSTGCYRLVAEDTP
jgi:hypothetical protein